MPPHFTIHYILLNIPFTLSFINITNLYSTPFDHYPLFLSLLLDASVSYVNSMKHLNHMFCNNLLSYTIFKIFITLYFFYI